MIAVGEPGIGRLLDIVDARYQPVFESAEIYGHGAGNRISPDKRERMTGAMIQLFGARAGDLSVAGSHRRLAAALWSRLPGGCAA